MTIKHSTKRSLIASILVLCLCFTSLIGTTFAWFTDEVSSSGNIIKTGSLKVALHYADGKEAPASANWKDASKGALYTADQLWEPGYTDAKHLKISNVGTLSLKYQLAILPTGEVSALANVIDVYYIDNAVAITDRTDLSAYKPVGTLADVIKNGIKQGSLDAGTNYTATIVLKMQESADNDYQGLSVGDDFTIRILATQCITESDSLGNDYDADAWVEGMLVYTASDLQAAINAGENVVLMNDIELSETIVISASDVTAYSLRSSAPAAQVINLNGNTIKGTMHKDDGHVLKNEGNLVICNGTISSTAANGGSAIMNKGTLTVDNVTLNGAPNANGSWPSYAVNNVGKLTINNSKITSVHGGVCSYGEGAVVTMNETDIDMKGIPGFTSHGLYTYSGGSIVVTSGNIANNATDQNATGASVINGTVKVLGGTFVGRIESYYGTPVLNGGTYNTKPNASFVAKGCETKDNGDGTFSVVLPQAAFDEIMKDAQAGDTVEVPEGTFTFPSASIKEGMTINCSPDTVFEGTTKLDINGATVVGGTFSNPTGTAVDQTINGTFKDCTFTGKNGLRWCYAGDSVVFENCVFDGSTYGVHFDGGANEVIFRNCTISGFNTMGGAITNLVMEGCTFKANDRSNYNGINLWGNTEMTDCVFVFDGSVDNEWVDLCNSNQTVSFTNCVVTDGEKETPIEYVVGNFGVGNTITIDGEVVCIASTEEVFADAINNGKSENIYLSYGEYKMPSNGTTKTLNIKGTNDTVVNVTLGAYMENANVSFEGITIKTGTGMVNGNGSDYAAFYSKDVTYTNCTFEGPMRVGRDGAKFVNCTFNSLGNDYVWTYGNDVTFEGCTFNTDGKAILIYSDGGNEVSKVSVKNCTFNSTKGAKAGAIANQNCAAIEIHNYGNGVDLVTEGNTYDNNFSGEWRIKTYENGKPQVFVNGTEYTTIAIDGKKMTIDANKNVTVE